MMKPIIQYLLSAMAILVIPFGEASAQFPNGGKGEKTLGSSAQGREFWIAMPENDYSNKVFSALELYISSSANTTVVVEHAATGFKMTMPITAYRITTFSTATATALWNWEVKSNESPENMAIHVYSERPISVYVLNSKERSTDGYMAIPVQAWGKEYFHCSYYDRNDETLDKKWGAGFLIIAAERSTEVVIELRGKNIDGSGKTVKGNSPPTILKTVLNRGDVFNVRGNGETIGVFDLSGSRITSNKPVGLVSYHSRAMIPTNNLNGRSYLVEMMPPVSAWGKQYVSLELKRESKGDFFRIMAAQDNTTWQLTSYDKVTGALLRKTPKRVLSRGEFFEIENNFAGRGAVQSISGTTIWTADKPVLVMQYSYSTFWDKTNDFDPFMTVVTPIEQFINASVFQVPTTQGFSTHWLNLLIVGDSSDSQHHKLRSVQLNGNPIWKNSQTLFNSRIPNTNLYWAHLRVEPGSNFLESSTQVGATLYGFGNFNSYGMPAALALRKLDEMDTLPPLLQRSEYCGDALFRSTELRTFVGNGNAAPQIDQGIYSIELVEYLSSNYRLRYLTLPTIPNDPAPKEFEFILEVIDKNVAGVGVVSVVDRAGNISTDTVRYFPPGVYAAQETMNFGLQRLGLSKTLTCEVSNMSSQPILIKNITLSLGQVFFLADSQPTSNVILPPAKSLQILLRYKPVEESTSELTKDVDILKIELECSAIEVACSGRGIRPCVVVSDWDASKVIVGSERCSGQGGSVAISLKNKGTDTAKVFSLALRAADTIFSLQNISPSLPYSIAPGASISIEGICFAPKVVGEFRAELIVESDSYGSDCAAIATLSGVGVAAGPFLDNAQFPITRVGNSNRLSVDLYNKGDTELRLTELQLTGSSDFSILKTTPTLSVAAPIVLHPHQLTPVAVEIEFLPTSVGYAKADIFAIFEDAPPISAKIHGVGYVPEITTQGYVFPDSIPLHVPSTGGLLTIENPHQFSALEVVDIDIENAGDFRIYITHLPLVIPPQGKATIPVGFSPTQVGKRTGIAIIHSDAVSGPEPLRLRLDTVYFTGRGFKSDNGRPNIVVLEVLDFGEVNVCDARTLEFPINNLGGTAPLELYGFDILEAQYPNVFTIDDTAIPALALPNIPIKFPVTFRPNFAGYFEITIRIRDNIGSEKTMILRGVGTRILLTATLPYTVQAEPGEAILLPISIRSRDIGLAKLHSVSIAIESEVKNIEFLPPSRLSKVNVAGWKSISQPKVLQFGDKQRVEWTIGGESYLETQGVIAEISAAPLLGDKVEIPLILTVWADTSEFCGELSSQNGTVTLQGCFIDARLIQSGSPYSLVVQNIPVIDNRLSLSYSIGFPSTVHIELFNSNGDMVYSKILNPSVSGIFEESVDVAELPSGVYICKLRAGLFMATNPVLIVR